jgi:hypothetical protein
MSHSISVTAQCAYISATGIRCKRATTVTHPLCAQHTRSILGFEVKPSHIVPAGLGLYATRNFDKGTILMEYHGDKLTIKQYAERYAETGFGTYGMTLNKQYVLDACKTSAGLGRYICDYHGSGQKPNVRYYSTGKIVEIIAIRPINTGDELYADYGREILEAMGILPSKKQRIPKS